jgi:hypothetical protein
MCLTDLTASVRLFSVTPDHRQVLAAPSDVLIPAVDGNTKQRQIGPWIRTFMTCRDGWIEAQFKKTVTYTSPLEAPYWAYTKPSKLGKKGRKWDGMWDAELFVSMFDKTETAALSALLTKLDALELGTLYDREQAYGVLMGLAGATSATPWPQQPMGQRAHKPRRRRLEWRDANGKVVKVYADTYQPHADPECACERCTVFRATTKHTRKNTKK